MTFESKALPAQRDAVAPDGSDVRVLLSLAAGSAAHFELGPGHTSVAVRHRTVEELWFVLSGAGQMWAGGALVPLTAGTCLAIPVGTPFQFRCTGHEPLRAVGVTMPPWPGDGEAVAAEGPWTPTVAPGPGLS